MQLRYSLHGRLHMGRWGAQKLKWPAQTRSHFASTSPTVLKTVNSVLYEWIASWYHTAIFLVAPLNLWKLPVLNIKSSSSCAKKKAFSLTFRPKSATKQPEADRAERNHICPFYFILPTSTMLAYWSISLPITLQILQLTKVSHFSV